MENLTTAQIWKEKMQFDLEAIRTGIFSLEHGIKENPDPEVEHSRLEHPWYGVWFSLLAEHFEGKTNLFVRAQGWVSRYVNDDDENQRYRESLVPDFMVVLQCRGEHLPVLQNTREEAERRGIDLRAIIRQVAAIIEIKCPPKKDEDYLDRENAIANAVKALKDQIQIYFANKRWHIDNYPTVIGIAVAGHYWTWKVYTRDNIGRDPLPEYQDPTYTQRTLTKTVEVYDGRSFCLGTQESDDQMDEMKRSIYTLKGANRFNVKWVSST